jgi:hypothetical protein
MRAIQVQKEEQFKRLLDRVSNDTQRAGDYWRLLRGLQTAVSEYGREFSQNPAFWGFTFNALNEVTLSYLTRLYDKTRDSLNLESFLLTVKSCSGYFSEQAFRQRRLDSPHLESLASTRRTLDLSVLTADIASVSDNDPLVKRLRDFRNNYVAHRDAEIVRDPSLSSQTGLTVGDIDALVERAARIVRYYNLLYSGTFLSAEVIGADDYKELLQIVKEHLDVFTAACDEDYRRAREGSGATARAGGKVA